MFLTSLLHSLFDTLILRNLLVLFKRCDLFLESNNLVIPYIPHNTRRPELYQGTKASDFYVDGVKNSTPLKLSLWEFHNLKFVFSIEISSRDPKKSSYENELRRPMATIIRYYSYHYSKTGAFATIDTQFVLGFKHA